MKTPQLPTTAFRTLLLTTSPVLLITSSYRPSYQKLLSGLPVLPCFLMFPQFWKCSSEIKSFICLITAIAEFSSSGKNFLLSSTPTAKLVPIQSVLTVPSGYVYYGIYLTELQLCSTFFIRSKEFYENRVSFLCITQCLAQLSAQ